MTKKYNTRRSLKSVSTFLLASTALLVSNTTLHAEEAPAGPLSLQEAIAASTPIFHARLRYEGVDQDPFTEQADALTYRLRFGFETGSFANTKFLIDAEYVQDLQDDFNSTINGKGAFPVIPDPNVSELNRLQLTNTSLPATKVILGRQRINLDDQRFVGAVGWRQNEQTFDALRVVNTGLKNVTIDATYIDKVHRIFGDDSPIGNFESESYLFNVGYKVPLEGAKLSLKAFAYLLEFDNAAGLSSETYGVSAGYKSGPFGLKGTYATQGDYGNQPVDYDADYYTAEASLSGGGWSGAIGYESLGGDGTRGFSTPLATLHKFNGFADKFLGTPAVGLEDTYAKVVYKKKNVGPFKVLALTAFYHDFSSESTSADFGDEIDFVGVASLGKTKFLLKYADFETDGFATDTEKLWFQVEYAY